MAWLTVVLPSKFASKKKTPRFVCLSDRGPGRPMHRIGGSDTGTYLACMAVLAGLGGYIRMLLGVD